MHYTISQCDCTGLGLLFPLFPAMTFTFKLHVQHLNLLLFVLPPVGKPLTRVWYSL